MTPGSVEDAFAVAVAVAAAEVGVEAEEGTLVEAAGVHVWRSWKYRQCCHPIAWR